MDKSAEISHSKLNFNKKRIIDRFVIFLARGFSNYFWIIVDILSSKNQRISNYYETLIGKEYANECKSFNLSKGKKILHIGCGSYPLTEITIAKLFDVNIVGIDKNLKAVKRANEVILQKRLKNKIKIEQGNGSNFPVKKFDMIIVSSCAVPKKDILNHILKTAKQECFIIVRDLDIETDEILTCIKNQKNITIVKRIHHPVPSIFPIGWEAFHLIKK